MRHRKKTFKKFNKLFLGNLLEELKKKKHIKTNKKNYKSLINFSKRKKIKISKKIINIKKGDNSKIFILYIK